ncbi:MAG: hypothetical protein M1824_005069 [Vezdaea acicularis]|nr:MAG: hypothetical protein M1824_005069 [Vezdaea acicularis]
MTSSAPDYYKILEIAPTATAQQIRDAYKRAALKSHPDRVPSDSPERPARTRKFQAINDAYYTLSDPARRRDYDAARTYSRPGGAGFYNSPFSNVDTDDEAEGEDVDADEEVPRPDGQQRRGGWGSFFGFGGQNAQREERHANEQFGSVFEEMLRDEGLAEGQEAAPTGKFWSLVGAASGGAMGFIIANAPGAVAGAVAGNRLGAVRDKRGKSVYSVFQELPQADKARLLSELATKVFGYAVGS